MHIARVADGVSSQRQRFARNGSEMIMFATKVVLLENKVLLKIVNDK
jgi:hypothetical protein